MQNTELTSQHRLVLRYYHKLMEKSGEPPTLRELADAVGLTHNTVRHHLNTLTARGYIAEARITVIRLRLTPKALKALKLTPKGLKAI